MLGKLSRIVAITALSALPFGASAADLTLPVTWLRVAVETPPTLSNLDPAPDGLGRDGAELGRNDNATTGQFLGHKYTLDLSDVPLGGDPVDAARAALADARVLILDAPADVQLAIADLREAEGALLFNASAPDVRLRGADCRANLLHTIPSTAMRTDALAQFLVMRRWSKLALIEGPHPGDTAFAASLRASLTKFGLKPGPSKTWTFDADMRRNARQEVPLFTQSLGDHDALLIADELNDFGRYIAYNTWLPRPVAGSEGLVPLAWADVVEQWGAAQLQSRFEKLAARGMQSRDYAAWAAMRSLGEAVTRTNSTDPETLRAYILGDTFELAGFKGRPMSFRPWNGQLRQPIPLVQPRALVAMAPLDGFLHQSNDLDTLGQDQPETTCTAFKD